MSSLKTYREKRDFRKTGEPPPKRGRQRGSQFVVQKHDARRLHFDLRLELDGVLKSWAVTRGPSLVPGEKRLAVQTEDHPMEYLEWEGVIPKGEYGGGTMIVWDRGSWDAERDPRVALSKGKLDFTLSGKRLKGRWHLVRMRRRPSETKDQWLLIKSSDEHARKPGDPEIVEEEHTSVLTNRTNEELAQGGELRADHAAPRNKAAKRKRPPPAAKVPGARKGILPAFVEPSLALLKQSPPAGAKWVHEIKYDGYRLQARLDGDEVKLLTRRGLDWTKRFPTIARAITQLPAASALIDGEAVVQDERGLPSFSGLQGDLKSGRHDRMIFYAFDLLYCEGMDLRAIPLRERKRLLRDLLDGFAQDSAVRFSDHVENDGSAVHRQACLMGLEGIVSKRIDLPYVSGRGEHWIKIKCAEGQEFVILGYVPSTALRGALGSLVLGYYDKGNLVHAGRAGTGFSADQAIALRKLLDALPAAAPRFEKQLPRASVKDVKWVKPHYVAEVEFRGWTADGLLRQASFKGLREDKEPTDIGLERRQARSASEGDDRSFALTHPERILWADRGITKRGLADFYAAIAPWILPHVTHRVLSLVRCPSGAAQDCFYAKHAWQGLSHSIRRVDVGEEAPMLAIEDLDGLMALVQASVLEIHPWGSEASDLERPDRIIFDLDPGEGIAWSSVISAAFEVRDRLHALGLKSFVKTSGGKGLHVMVPIAPQAGWDDVKDFARRIAEAMAADTPKLFIARMTKSLRRGRIFVDYFRNGRGATAVAAYSTRARPGAPVSAPLAWEELSPAIGPAHFDVSNLPQRLAHLGADPWEGFLSLRQSMPPLEASAGTRSRRPPQTK